MVNTISVHHSNIKLHLSFLYVIHLSHLFCLLPKSYFIFVINRHQLKPILLRFRTHYRRWTLFIPLLFYGFNVIHRNGTRWLNSILLWNHWKLTLCSGFCLGFIYIFLCSDGRGGGLLWYLALTALVEIVCSNVGEHQMLSFDRYSDIVIWIPYSGFNFGLTAPAEDGFWQPQASFDWRGSACSDYCGCSSKILTSEEGDVWFCFKLLFWLILVKLIGCSSAWIFAGSPARFRRRCVINDVIFLNWSSA